MSKARIHLLDELRGFCVVLMIAFHAFYTVGFLFNWKTAIDLFYFFQPAEPFFAGIFIVLCGFSCRLSHSNLKRGLLLAAVAAGMSLVLYVVMRDQMIWFGVLHCLAVCILLFAALKPLLDRVPPLVGAVLSALLMLLTWHFPFYNGGYIGIGETVWWQWPITWAQTVWLLPLGIGEWSMFGADYFPLIPWVFCFLCGTFLGAYRDRFPAFAMKKHLPPLAFIGRHTLWIYVIHQPIIYGICYLIAMVM